MLNRLTAMALLALLTGVMVLQPATSTVQASFTLVGLADGGKPSGSSLSPAGSLTIVSDDSGAPVRYTISLAWVRGRLPEIAQDDLLSVEVEVLPDGTLVASSVTNQTDRQGTANQGRSTGSVQIREQPRQPSTTDKSNEGPPTSTGTPTPASTNVIRILDTAGNVGWYTSLQLNASGKPVVSYYDEGNGDLKLLVCGDATCSAGTTIRTLDSGGDVGLNTSLQLNASGHPVVSYGSAIINDLKLIVCGDATCSAPTIRTLDTAFDVGRYPSLQLSASGHPVVSYYDEGNGDLKLLVCGDATCSASTIRTLDVGGIVGRDNSLQLHASGKLVVSYYDSTNGDLKLMVCGDATCLAGTTIRTLDTAGNVGRYTSLQLNASGYPVVSYYDSTNGDLKLLVCDDDTCSAPTIRILDTAGNVGWYTSLQLNVSGKPVVSYYDEGNGDLKLLVCGDATCSAPTIRTLDSGGDVGQYTSLQLNASGHPVVSYYDVTNGNLKLIVCGDATCRP
ncbi:MAG: hypothetical protein IT306_08035 [Chloroflexi bacterium]|nr:hypothetical protein [Chloroflexota bacterium]